ncbi:PSD1 and planctomycete cytochrome C domain-containing protein [Horticoccus sp. 23ND18S-11]|uniref:PSD1 and planctomycete cytochrome C domain-containing protein n=1 Tax=Horticoccus sp. 23ND18S-11 TaxID=3391832 RepID=UPI0039C9A7A8
MSPVRSFSVLSALVLASAASAAVDYNRDIKPILAENCFSCHGFDEKGRKAKLRLDVAESAFTERNGFTAITPRDLTKSEAWIRITSTDEEEVMPPPDSHRSLTPDQKQKIKTWIEEGATYAEHWSFVPPKKAALPVSGSTAIDAFVRAQLTKEGLKPALAADRRTLIRRLSFDLVGLPPSAAEVEAFIADRDPKAYENLVARLLARPQFGERLALDWLDAARYADTNGFSIDGGRHMWLWRDWVIQAFNDNKPYDRFLFEQIAGDLLPNRTEADLIASGFQRNNMTTHEGGTIPEENLVNYNADRVKTLGEAVLGLTFACAQCHDHKFDPITQKDYYRLFAYFNSLGDRGLDGNAGVNAGPMAMARTVLKANEEKELGRRIAALKTQLVTRDDALLRSWATREREQLATRGRGFELHPVKVAKVSTPNRADLDVEESRRVRIRQAGDLAAIDISAELPKLSAPITGLRVVMYPLPELPGGGWGKGPITRAAAQASKTKAAKTKMAPAESERSKGTFRLTALSISADQIPGDQIDLHKLRRISRVTANTWEEANPPAGCLDPRNDSGWSPDLAASGTVHLTATLAEPLRAADTPFLNVQLNFGAGRSLLPELVEVFVTTGTDDGTDLPTEIVAALAVPDATRDAATTERLWRYCAQHAVELKRARVDLANLEERLAALTQPFSTMVMAVADKPRDTFILNRGDYTQPTEKVTPGTPAALPLPGDGAAADRLGLARWVTMPQNPLTARVAVNRFWKQLFGTGIVATPADFGSQGEWPSHPELLDWLAVDFMEHGWDVKRLMAQMVMSETYRQSSVAAPALLERDPQNRLLARGPRFRLPAELVRDAALQVSGLLVPQVGGPSVNPYLPFDLWREVSHYGSSPATAQTFVQDHGDKLYRRSLYTYWKRTAPPPSMAAFDAPNREVCTVARGNTTTPLQALVLLNDVQFVEAARVFAEKILARGGNDSARVAWAFAECLSRPPEANELRVVAGALQRERERYAKNEPAARALLAAGEAPRSSKLDLADHAAWTQVASLLLNLSETVTRN